MTIPKLDHIVIILPQSATEEALLHEAKPFKKKFTLSKGGFHTDRKSQNVLISLADGVYLELIAFTSTPPPEHRWAQRTPIKLIDFAFLGQPENGKRAYNDGAKGGRGECQWIVTAPKEEWGVGQIPFWCGDITPRELRVPKPKEHPSGVTGVKKITVLVDSDGEVERVTKIYQEIVGSEKLEVGTPEGGKVEIEVKEAETQDEQIALEADGPGVYKVEFDVPGVVLSNSSL